MSSLTAVIVPSKPGRDENQSGDASFSTHSLLNTRWSLETKLRINWPSNQQSGKLADILTRILESIPKKLGTVVHAHKIPTLGN